MDKDKAEQLVDYLIKHLQNAGDFVADQAPLVVQELIVWQRCWTTISAVACLLVIPIAMLVIRWCIRKAGTRNYGPEPPEAFLGIGAGFLIFLSTVGVCVNTYNAVKVWCAPRVYLIEYARDLVKK